MKRAVLFCGVALAVVGIAVAAKWFAWRSDLNRLKTPDSITYETGLQLPLDARITAAQAQTFSLVDGDNYDWLIQSDTSLATWAASNMSIEQGGWEHIRYLSEFGDFKSEIHPNAKFGGVWRAFRNVRGHEETSYLFLSDDGRVGILSTFRP